MQLKYDFERSAPALALCSFTVDTSFIAFVICWVLWMLLRRRLMSRIEAITLLLSVSC